MPFAVYVLGLTIFSMTTSEFMVAGMMPSLSAQFGVSVAAIGYLISAYAAGMVVGGPILTVALLKAPPKRAMLALALVFAAGQALGAMAGSYGEMLTARIITGVSSSACFGVALSICAGLVKPEVRGRAASIVIGGLMIATVLGMPAAALIEQQFGWRVSFWAVAVLVLLSTLAGQKAIPAIPRPASVSWTGEFSAFRNKHLWAAYATSSLIIGATFAAFSYFAPILTELTGFAPASVPAVMVVYGAATVIGNMITGRLADKYPMPILSVGLLMIIAALMVLGLGAQYPAAALGGIILLGFTGVSLNPAMATRVMRTGNAGPLVNTVHTSVITFGVVMGSSIGGMTIAAGYGVVSPAGSARCWACLDSYRCCHI